MDFEAKLSFEDAINPSPQSLQLLKLFERDASILNTYCGSLLKAFDRVSVASNEVLAANQNLSKHLKLFKDLDFTINNGSKLIGEILMNFSIQLDELSSHCQLLTSQLSESVVRPMTKLMQIDMPELMMLSEQYDAANVAHDEAVGKFMKISKKRDASEERPRLTSSNELFDSRRKLHDISLKYFSCVNQLQYKRACYLLESNVNYFTTQKLYAASMHESFSAAGVDDHIQAVMETLKNLLEHLESEKTTDSHEILKLSAEVSLLCHPDSRINNTANRPGISETGKSGYLYYRSRTLMISHWVRAYVSVDVARRNVRIQLPSDIHSTLLLDLSDGDVQALPAEVDDRRNTFEIIAKKTKKQIYFQSENQLDRDEWISYINFVSQPNNVGMSGFSIQLPSSHEASGNRRCAVDSPSHDHFSSHNSEMSNTVPLLDNPIQFDISSSSEDFPPLPNWLGRKSTTCNSRVNPFGDEETSSEPVSANINNESLGSFAHTYHIRFVGSVRVDSLTQQEINDQILCEVMQKILAARALHGLFRMSEVGMLIATDGIYLLDMTKSFVKARFPLHRVVHMTTHLENDKLFAFVTSSTESKNELTYHVFESAVPSLTIIETFRMIENVTSDISELAVLSSLAELNVVSNETAFANPSSNLAESSEENQDH